MKLRLFVIVTMLTFFPLSGMAVDGAWTYNGDNNWNNSGCWLNGIIADGTNGVADFSYCDFNATRTCNLAVNRTIGAVIFGDQISDNNLVLSGGGTYALTLAVSNGLPAISVLGVRTATINAAIAGSSGFERRGAGTLVLASTNTVTGQVVLNCGQTILDFGGALSSTSDLFNAGVPLTMSGGSALAIQGKASTMNSQVFNGLTISNGHVSISAVNGAGGTASLNLGSVSLQGFGMVNFNPPASGVIAAPMPNDGSGIIGCFATVYSNSWAMNNGANIITSYTGYATNILLPGSNATVIASRSMTNTSVNSLLFSNNVNTLTLTLSGTNVISAGGIMFAPGTPTTGNYYQRFSGGMLTSGTNELIVIDNHTVDRRTGGNITASFDSGIIDNGATSVALRVASYGSSVGSIYGSLTQIVRTNNTYSGGTYLYGGGLYIYGDSSLGAVPASRQTNITAVSGFNWLKPQTAMTIHSNRTIQVNSNAYLVLDAGNTLTINGTITGSGTLMGPPSYGGTVILNGSNTMTGTIEANNAGLRVTEGVGLPLTANLRLSGNGGDQGIVEMSGNFTRQLGIGPGQVAWGSPTYAYYGGGFAAVGGPLTVNIGGSGSNLVWGQANFYMGGQNYIQFGNGNSTDPVTWVNPIDLNAYNGSRWIYVRGVATMQGVISGVGCQLCKNLPGTLILAAGNTYGTGTRIDQGAVVAGFDGALGSAPAAPALNIWFYNGSGTLQAGGNLNLASTRNIWIGNSTYPAILDSSNSVMTVNGGISGIGSLVKAGSGQLILAGVNTYAGSTVISNGLLTVNSSVPGDVTIGAASALGGTGVIYGTVSAGSGGMVMAGGTNSGGIFTINNPLVMNSGSVLGWQFDSTPGFIAVSNQVVLTAGGINVLRLFNPKGLPEPVSQQFDIMTWPASAVDPVTNVTWTVEKPVGGGAEGWANPQVTIDTTGNRIYLTFKPAGFPVVDNSIGASSIRTNSAVLNATYTSTGAAAQAYIYWGTADGGTNKESWENVYSNGLTGFGPFSLALTNLYYGPRYYYRCYASNSAGECWYPVSSNFVTLAPNTYVSGLRGSAFLNVSFSTAVLTLSDGSYSASSSRVFSGNKAGTVLAMQEVPSWNVLAVGEVSGFGMFPGFSASGIANAMVVFSGQFIPRVSGPHNFRWDCDDLGMMYLDLNGDGVFQAGEGLVGSPVWAGNGNVTLTAGQPYNFIYMALNNGGPGTENFWLTEPGQSETRVNTSVQAGMWRCVSGGAGVLSNSVSSVTASSAVLGVSVSASNSIADIRVYWGPVDCTNVTSAWANSAYVGSATNAITNLNFLAAGLSVNSTYYLRFRASNAGFDNWGDVVSFRTLYASTVSDSKASPQKVKINFSGYNRVETLTNFPALVVLGGGMTNFSFSQFVSQYGADLRFLDEAQTNELKYEIDQWVPPTNMAAIRGLALWLKADSGVVTNSSGFVTSWLDQSGLGRNIEGYYGIPGVNTNGPGGKPVVTFNGASYLWTTYNFDTLSQYTIVSIARYAGPDSYYRVISSMDHNYLFGFHGNQTERFFAEGWIQSTGPNNDTNWHVHAGSINNDPDPKANFWTDGNWLAVNNTGSDNSNYKPGRLELGGWGGGNEMSKCEVAEVMIFDRVLGADELSGIGAYISQKYGMRNHYAQKTGQASVWVQVPAFTNNCSIWACWGNTNLATVPPYTTNGAVWADGYVGVWHMKDSYAADSTSNRYNATAYGGAINASGAIGDAQSFSSASSTYLSMGDIKVSPTITVEALAYSTNFNQNSFILGKNPQNTQWELFFESSQLKWRTVIGSGDVVMARPSDSNWHYTAAVQAGSTGYLYLDGAAGVSGANSPITNGTGNVEMGRFNSGYYFNGLLDEVRISNVARSSNWLWACWFNQISNGVFASYPVVAGINNSAATNITSTSAVINASLYTTGGVADVWALWGAGEGGTNAVAWASSNLVGSFSTSTNVSLTVTGLVSGGTCYFTFRAVTAGTGAWAVGTKNFTALVSGAAYPCRMKVTFSGYNRSETLTNFPALVTLNETLPGFLYNRLQPGATDLRFMDEGEVNELNYEIDTIDTNGSSYVWVRVPQFTNSCSVWAYWGNTNAIVAPAYTTNGAVWSQGFAAVWHMNQTNALDSTGNRNNGSAVNNTNLAGQVGGAQGFSGNGAYINVPHSSSLDLYGGGNWSNLSMSAYIRVNTWAGDWRNIVGKIGWSSAGWAYYVHVTDQGWIDSNVNIANHEVTSSNQVSAAGRWQHLFVVKYDTVERIYLDGQEVGSRAATGVIPRNTEMVRIGGYRSGDENYFNGAIDEVRLSSTAYSSNWVTACWLNVASNSSFVTFSPATGMKNISASGVTATSAVLNATLYTTGASNDVIVYWNTNNCGTNAALWVNNSNVGSWTNIASTNISCLVTGLTADTRYYFRFRATNSTDSAWAPDVLSFRTAILPVVYPYRMQITFSGYNKGETLTNFPALVVLRESANGFLYNRVSATGADLRFTDEATNELNCEIESWDTNGSSYVWVQVPQFTNSCSIWANWGVTNAPVPVYRTNGLTWNAGFAGVWHLNANALDSTANHYDGAVYGGLNSVPVDGLIGRAWSFDGLDNAIRVSRMVQDDFTLACWMKANVGSYGGGAWANGNGLMDAETPGTVNDFGLSYLNNQAAFGTGNPDQTLQSGTLINDKSWHYVVATRVSATGVKKIYVDGRDWGSQASSVASLTAPGSIVFGGIQTWNNYFDGRIDEVEISSVPRSSNWIWACYMSQGSNSMFSTAGMVQGGTLPVINDNNGASSIMLNGATFNGNLMSTGGAPVAVTVYWGGVDGGSNKLAWAKTNNFGVSAVGLLSTNLTGLASASNYYYRFYASNSFGGAWAPSSTRFSTARYRTKIQFAGYNRSEVLTNFPALVVLKEGANGYSARQCTSPVGGDLRFANSNETVMLNHEIERWETNGSSYVWVQVPELTDNCCVWAYWGGSDTNSPSYSTNGATWARDYVGVWHFNAPNSGFKYQDSTANRYDGLNFGCDNVRGQVGGAANFIGSLKYVDITGIGCASVSYTFQYWVKTIQATSYTLDISSGRLINRIENGGLRTYDSSSQWRTIAGAGVNNGQWRQAVFVLDGSSMKGSIYLDGVLCGSDITYQPTMIGGTARIGCDQGGPFWNHFDGLMDELQISSVVRSPNWIWACYMNQGSNSIFNAVAATESSSLPVVNNAGGASAITMSSATMNGYLASTGGAPSTVWLCWGATDGVTNRAAWINKVNLGIYDVGDVTMDVSGLVAGSVYFYRYYASNSFGTSWSPYTAVFAPAKYQMKITFTGYDRPETLTNFPALVKFSEGSNGFSYSQCSSRAGGDLRFVNDSETDGLNYEIEKWDTNGTSYVWVQIPAMTNNSQIWAYWGGSDTNPPAYALDGSAWSDDFGGVWHMNDSSVLDSTANRFNSIGSADIAVSAGAVGDGQRFGGNNSYVSLPSGPGQGVGSNITVMAWARLSAAAGDYQAIVSERFAGDGDIEFELYCNYGRLSGGFYTTASNWKTVTEPTPFPGNQWILVTAVYDGNTINLYRNSELVSQLTGIGLQLPIGVNGWYIGHRHDGSDSWNGSIDEVRVSRVANSANWIWACWMNMASNSSFMSAETFVSNEGGATYLTSSSADLRGFLNHSDGIPTFAWLYYGQVDGGSVATNWQGTNYLGAVSVGSLVTSVYGLTPDANYYYRYYASNSVRGAWASPAAKFTTGAVTVRATDASASEIGPDPGMFTVYRPASMTNIAMTVNYNLDGSTAVNGVNYETLSGIVTIPAGQTNASIIVMPIECAPIQRGNTVVLTLAAGNYRVGALNTATVTVNDAVEILDDWQYKMKITFPGYGRAEVLTNFPALVVFNTGMANFNYASFCLPASGGDLLFANSNRTTFLNYEVDEWNTNGNSYVWVQVPELAGTNTFIWAYWRNRFITRLPAYATNGSAWSDGYLGVWHMKQTNALDSTDNRFNASAVGNNTNAVGLFATAQGFSSSAGSYISCMPAPSLSNQSFTVSAWARRGATGGGVDRYFFGHGVAGINNSGLHFGFRGSDVFTFAFWANDLNTAAIYVDTADWHFWAGTFDTRGSLVRKLYMDGGVIAQDAPGWGYQGSSLTPLRIGQGPSGQSFDGLLDEVRIDGVSRSANWVWACYQNYLSNSVFNAYGNADKTIWGTVIRLK